MEAAECASRYENTERRLEDAASRGLLYLGMGVSGGEEWARNGAVDLHAWRPQRGLQQCPVYPLQNSCPGGRWPMNHLHGLGSAGNLVKMVHNGIEYGDMQLSSEAYDILKNVGGLSNNELAQVFDDWNRGKLESFLIEITADIFSVSDDINSSTLLVDMILDKTGMKGTSEWTVQQAAELTIVAPTIAASLDSRYISGLKDERALLQLRWH